MGHLDEYIKDALDEGHSKKEIAKRLMKAGYSKKAVRDALGYTGSAEHTILKISIALILGVVLILGALQFYQPIEEAPTGPVGIPKVVITPDRIQRIAGLNKKNTRLKYKRVEDASVLLLKACSGDCAYFDRDNTKAACAKSTVMYNFIKGLARGSCPGDLGVYTTDLGQEINMDDTCNGIVSGTCPSTGPEKGFCRGYNKEIYCTMEPPESRLDMNDCSKFMKELKVLVKGEATKDLNACISNYLSTIVPCQAFATDTCEETFNNYVDDVAAVQSRKSLGSGFSCKSNIPEIGLLCERPEVGWTSFTRMQIGEQPMR